MFKYIVYATPMFLTYLFFKGGMRANSEFMTFFCGTQAREAWSSGRFLLTKVQLYYQFCHDGIADEESLASEMYVCGRKGECPVVDTLLCSP